MRNTNKMTRRITAVTLASALAVAVYLNWQYARTDWSDSTEELRTATTAAEPVSIVMDGLQTEEERLESGGKNYGEAQLVSLSKSSGGEFFAQARLSREKAHDSALDTIQRSLKNSSLSKEEKAVYTTQLSQNLANISAENEIETLIRAKGFSDCLCFLQNGRADLTVMTEGDALDAAQVAQIRDIVMNRSNIPAQNITVVEVK